MAITISITGIDDVIKRLDHAAGNEALRRAMERSVERLRNRMADYPPQKLNSSYTRTGKLGESWTKRVESMATGVRGKVGNNRKYAPFVQSSAFQATVHRGRWQTDQQVLERETEAIEGFFREELQRSLDGR